MRFTYKIAKWLIIFSITTIIALFICKFCYLENIKNIFFQYKIFRVLEGERDFIVDILLGICTSFWFSTVPAIIAYFNQKKKYHEELESFFITIKNRCYERLFFEANSYDDVPEEANAIFNYLNEKRYLTLKYWPPLLRIRVKLYKLNRIIINKLTKKSSLQTSSYSKENTYALICSIYSDLYSYFAYIIMHNYTMKDYERSINYCNSKIKPNELWNEYNTHLLLLEEEKEEYEKQFKARLGLAIKSKKDLFIKFYSVNQKLHFNFKQNDFMSILMHGDNLVVEDEIIEYVKKDKITIEDLNKAAEKHNNNIHI